MNRGYRYSRYLALANYYADVNNVAEFASVDPRQWFRGKQEIKTIPVSQVPASQMGRVASYDPYWAAKGMGLDPAFHDDFAQNYQNYRKGMAMVNEADTQAARAAARAGKRGRQIVDDYVGTGRYPTPPLTRRISRGVGRLAQKNPYLAGAGAALLGTGALAGGAYALRRSGLLDEQY